ncbi:MAG: VanZ family protein [Chitinophagaceae bacterium]
MDKIKPSFIPAIGWFILSAILLTLPGSSFPKEDWLGKIWFDKWVHIGMFALLTFLWCWAFLRLRKSQETLKKVFMLTAMTAFLYGVGIEFVQKFLIPNRSFDLGDILADGAGCALGLIFSRRRYIKK